MPPELPPPTSILTSLFSAISQYLQFQSIRNAISGIVDFLYMFLNVVQGIVTSISTTFWLVKNAWLNARGLLAEAGGSIRGMAIDEWAMWHHLRWVLMPNTINWTLGWILHNWIWPLRQGLIHTIGWAARWHWYLLHWIHDNRAYTRLVQIRGRDWRSAFVYPQLTFLLSPWRVAYWYAQAITVAVSRYLNDYHHGETRDTVSRVVYANMSHLWQSFDRHLAEWLLTDVSRYGFGVDVPKFPAGSDKSMPPRPPGMWEPWTKEPPEPPNPAGQPSIPDVDWKF